MDWARVQVSLQLVAAVLLASVFTFVRSLAVSSLSCLSAVFAVVVLLSAAPDNHLGTRLIGVCTVAGSAWSATLLAGLLVSAAKLVSHPNALGGFPGAAYHVTLCVLSALMMALIAIARSARQPLTQLLSSFTAVVAGLLFILGQHAPLATFWAVDAGAILVSLLIAAAVALCVSALVLPSLANDEMARLCASSLQGLGHSMSSHYSQLLSWANQQDDPSSPRPRYATAGTASSSPAGRPAAVAQQQQLLHQCGSFKQRYSSEQQRHSRRWGLDFGRGIRPGQAMMPASSIFRGSSFWTSALAMFEELQAGREGDAATEAPEAQGQQLGQQQQEQQEGDTGQEKQHEEAQSEQDQVTLAPHTLRCTLAAPSPFAAASERAFSTEPVARESLDAEAAQLESSLPQVVLDCDGGEAAVSDALAAALHQQQQQDEQQASPSPPIDMEQQRSLLYDEPPPEQYHQGMRRSTFSFLMFDGKVIQGIRRRRGGGQSASQAAGRRAAAAMPHSGPAADLAATTDEFWEPFGRQMTPVGTAPPLVRNILLQLAGARALLPSARAEPPWLVLGGGAAAGSAGGHAAWEDLINAAERLAMRCAALEGTAQEVILMQMRLEGLHDQYGRIADACSIVSAQLAAFLAELATSIEALDGTSTVAAIRLLESPAATNARIQRQRLANSPAGDAGRVPANKLQTGGGPGAPGRPTSSQQAWSTWNGAHGMDMQQQQWRQQQRDSEAVAGVADTGTARQDARGMTLDRLCNTSLFTHRPEWETARQVLQGELDSALATYWQSVLSASKGSPFKVTRAREVMSLLFLWTCCNSLVEATEQLETAAARILDPQAAVSRNPTDDDKRSSLRGSQAGKRSSLDGSSGLEGGSGDGVRGRWLDGSGSFLKPLLRLLVIKPTLDRIKEVLWHDLPHALSSRQAFMKAMSSSKFQAAAKYFFATTSMMILTLSLTTSSPAVRVANPVFGFVATCVAMQDRVEATAEKITLRVAGTIIGASLGEAVMAHPIASNSPGILATALAVVAAVFGWFARGPLRVGVGLAIFTFVSVVLCQYRGCCGATHATTEYFLTRMLSVIAGCAWAALVSNLLLPSYTSDWAMNELATCLERSSNLLVDLYQHQYKCMKTAAVRAALVPAAAWEDAASKAGGTSNSECGEDAALSVHDVASASMKSSSAESASAYSESPIKPLFSILARPLVAGKAAVTTTPAGVGSPAGASDGSAAAPPPSMDEVARRLEAAELELAARLRPEVVAPLLAVQATLAKESVSWRHGPLATPQLAKDVLAGLTVLAHAIVAQRITLSPTPTMAPSSLSGHGFFFMGPLHETWLDVMGSVQRMARAAAQQLRKPTVEGAEVLANEIELLEQHRMRLRGAFLGVRRALHDDVRASFSTKPTTSSSACTPGAPLSAGPPAPQPAGLTGSAASRVDTQSPAPAASSGQFAHVQDSVQFFSWQFAASRCLNEITAVAWLALSASKEKLRTGRNGGRSRGSAVDTQGMGGRFRQAMQRLMALF